MTIWRRGDGREPATLGAVSAADEVRLAAALAQCEMALVRHDPVAGAAAGPGRPPRRRHARAPARRRAAAGLASRTAGEDPAARKVVQALTRAAAIENDAALLGRAR